MRLATFVSGGRTRFGAVFGADHLADVNLAYEALLRSRRHPRPGEYASAVVPSDAVGFLAGGEATIAAATEAVESLRGKDQSLLVDQGILVPVGRASLLPPVPVPPKLLCVGRNYVEHVEERHREIPTVPVIFVRFPASIAPPGCPVVRPRASSEFDWEGELAVVIGRSCRHVEPQRAMEVVAGYSIFNDGSIRDWQHQGNQWTAGKNFASSGSFGPHLVLKDEVADPQALELTTRINGEVVQHANTRQMIFDIPTLIAHISTFTPLEPGDVIATGTPSGVGAALNPPRFLVPGDRMTVEVEGLGTLENAVVQEA